MFVTVTLTSILIIISFYLYKSWIKKSNYWKDRGVKYVKPLPIIGNLLPFIMKRFSLADFIKHLYDQFPNERYFGVFQLNTPILFVRDPELIKQITIKHFDNFIDHQGFILNETDPYFSKNLFAVKGERWRNLRHTMTPVFTTSKMKNMYVLMENSIKQFMEYLRENVGNKTLQIEIQEMYKRLTMDVVASAAFGLNSDSLKNPENEFLKHGHEITNVTGIKRLVFLLNDSIPGLSKVLKLRLIDEESGRFFQAIIDKTIKAREEQKIYRPDLIHLLMVARQEKLKFQELTTQTTFKPVEGSSQFLTNEDIAAQALVFIIGGFDTTSILLSFTAYELAVNPDVQNKLRGEIKSIWTDNLTYDLVNEMKYLDMVVNESLRKWGPAIFGDRVCTKPFEILPEKEGEPTISLNVGDVVWIPNYGLQRDPKYFPDPERFDPERFNDENKAKRHPCTFNPFGQGPRNCIGSRFALLEAKLLFCYLLNEFELVPVAATQVPPQLSKETAFLEPVGGFQMGIKKL